MYSAPSCMFRFSAAMEGSAIQSWMRLIEASRAASAAFRTSGYRSLAAQAAEPKNMEPAPASPAAARNSRRSRPPGVRFDSVIICSSLGPVRLDRDDQAGNSPTSLDFLHITFDTDPIPSLKAGVASRIFSPSLL